MMELLGIPKPEAMTGISLLVHQQSPMLQ
jgi:hypothetical protein